MKILAITGGIASGKSTVCKFFRECGAVVLNADHLAHQIYRPGTAAYRALLRRYGKGILRKDRRINRSALSKIIFHSPREKKWVESKVHPATLGLIRRKLRALAKRRPPLILVEAALHAETGYYKKFPGLIVVDIKPEIQLYRLQRRGALSRAEALVRLKSQWPLKRKRALADWLIDNSGSRTHTRKQVRSLYQKLVSLRRPVPFPPKADPPPAEGAGSRRRRDLRSPVGT
jgi:dephospho-CoA kinase